MVSNLLVREDNGGVLPRGYATQSQAPSPTGPQISDVPSYLPLATASNPGSVVPDNTTITVAPTGVISAVNTVLGHNPTATASDVAVNGTATTYLRSDGAPAIQKASSSQFGLVKVDGTTITAAAGVITAVNSISYTAPTDFTPVLKFGGATTGITYSTQAGRYLQIGKQVFFTLEVALTSKGSAAGAATIDLPVTSENHTTQTIFNMYDSGNTYTGHVFGTLNVNTTSMALNIGNNGSTTAFDNTMASNSTIFIISGSYIAV